MTWVKHALIVYVLYSGFLQLVDFLVLKLDLLSLYSGSGLCLGALLERLDWMMSVLAIWVVELVVYVQLAMYICYLNWYHFEIMIGLENSE